MIWLYVIGWLISTSWYILTVIFIVKKQKKNTDELLSIIRLQDELIKAQKTKIDHYEEQLSRETVVELDEDFIKRLQEIEAKYRIVGIGK